jgi:hypothetical protein
MRPDDAIQEVHMDATTKFVAPGIVFLLTLASGVWLSRSGKPLNTAIFTLHKLIALGAVVATAIRTYSVLKNADIQAILIALIIVIGLCVAALFATGALMSANKPGYDRLLTIHEVSSLLALSAGTALFALVVRGAS